MCPPPAGSATYRSPGAPCARLERKKRASARALPVNRKRGRFFIGLRTPLSVMGRPRDQFSSKTRTRLNPFFPQYRKETHMIERPVYQRTSLAKESQVTPPKASKPDRPFCRPDALADEPSQTDHETSNEPGKRAQHARQRARRDGARNFRASGPSLRGNFQFQPNADTIQVSSAISHRILLGRMERGAPSPNCGCPEGFVAMQDELIGSHERNIAQKASHPPHEFEASFPVQLKGEALPLILFLPKPFPASRTNPKIHSQHGRSESEKGMPADAGGHHSETTKQRRCRPTVRDGLFIGNMNARSDEVRRPPGATQHQ